MNNYENLLKDKNILLGVTGSISAYKALELTRLFIKAGANVRVVMSESAKKFVTPLSFETLSRNSVLDDTNESWSSDFNHIKITSWADLFVIAPATANTIAKLANGIADNILLQCALAYSNMKLIAPSANTNMLNSPFTVANLKMLKVANFELVDTQSKELACATSGDGALAEPLEIFWHSARLLLKDSFYSNRRVIVTGGGSIEKIDDVRFLSNFSSGKMASALAKALFLKGADVNLISTKFDDDLPQIMHKLEVEEADEFLDYITDSVRIAKKGMMSKASIIEDEPLHLIQKEPYLFMAAAISDYKAKHKQSGKLKKEMLGEEFNLQLVQNKDIIASIDKDGIKTVAFKAEFDELNAKDSATKALNSKGVDAICLNILGSKNSFGSDQNEVEFISKNNTIRFDQDDKLNIALKIIEASKEL